MYLGYREYLDSFSNQILRKEKARSVFKKRTEKNISVYQNNFLYNHLDSLKNIYEGLFKSLGENNFNYFTFQYIKHFPPTEENIDEYGKGFPAFLEEQKELDGMVSIGGVGKVDELYFSLDLDRSIIVYKGIKELWESIVWDKKNQTLLNIDEEEELCLSLGSDGYFYLSKR